MGDKAKKLNDVIKIGKKFRGRAELIKYLKGKRLSASQLARAKCYECMGYFVDGASDCKVNTCPLYHYMPYKEVGIEYHETAPKSDFNLTGDTLIDVAADNIIN